MSAEELFRTEYQLLEIYHKKKKSRSSTEPKHQIRSVKDQQLKLAPTRTRVPASANTDAFAQVADNLTRIVDSVALPQDEVVADSSGSDAIQRLVELLKEHGDQLNEKIQKDKDLLSYLQGLSSYNLFENLASAFLHSMVPQGKQREENDQKINIAWTFEMTSRLSALDLQPMNRIMGFGAQYVHNHFAQWIQQHGGWENAFKIEGDDEMQ